MQPRVKKLLGTVLGESADPLLVSTIGGWLERCLGTEAIFASCMESNDFVTTSKAVFAMTVDRAGDEQEFQKWLSLIGHAFAGNMGPTRDEALRGFALGFFKALAWIYEIRIPVDARQVRAVIWAMAVHKPERGGSSLLSDRRFRGHLSEAIHDLMADEPWSVFQKYEFRELLISLETSLRARSGLALDDFGEAIVNAISLPLLLNLETEKRLKGIREIYDSLPRVD